MKKAAGRLFDTIQDRATRKRKAARLKTGFGPPDLIEARG
jgi:hypothetical protein